MIWKARYKFCRKQLLKFYNIIKLRVCSFEMIRYRVSNLRSLRSLCIKGTGQSTLSKHSPPPLMQGDPSDLPVFVKIEYNILTCIFNNSTIHVISYDNQTAVDCDNFLFNCNYRRNENNIDSYCR